MNWLMITQFQHKTRNIAGLMYRNKIIYKQKSIISFKSHCVFKNNEKLKLFHIVNAYINNFQIFNFHKALQCLELYIKCIK